MINTEDFIKKLELILDHYNLSASTFAEKINVQRSSLSHLLSGRNKPSLDFVLKIVEVFPEVDLYWLLFNEGNFPKAILPQALSLIPGTSAATAETITTPTLFEEVTIKATTDEPEKIIENPTQSNEENISSFPSVTNTPMKESDIEKIIVLYKNGTFKDYLKNK